jgi:hypothetical protein
MNNSSIRTADGSTHLKIVALALLASVVVVAIGVSVRPAAETTAGVHVPVKAGPAMIAEQNQRSTIR